MLCRVCAGYPACYVPPPPLSYPPLLALDPYYNFLNLAAQRASPTTTHPSLPAIVASSASNVALPVRSPPTGQTSLLSSRLPSVLANTSSIALPISSLPPPTYSSSLVHSSTPLALKPINSLSAVAASHQPFAKRAPPPAYHPPPPHLSGFTELTELARTWGTTTAPVKPSSQLDLYAERLRQLSAVSGGDKFNISSLYAAAAKKSAEDSLDLSKPKFSPQEDVVEDEEEEEAQDLSLRPRSPRPVSPAVSPPPSGPAESPEIRADILPPSNGGFGLMHSSSLVGELISKFGLSNIQEYQEAYRKALAESAMAGSIKRKLEEDVGGSPEKLRKSSDKDFLYAGTWLPSSSMYSSPPNSYVNSAVTSNLRDNMTAIKDKIKGTNRRSSLKDIALPPLPPGMTLPPIEPSAVRALVQKGRLDAIFDPELRKEIISKGRNDTCEYCGKVCSLIIYPKRALQYNPKRRKKDREHTVQGKQRKKVR